jgi:hypothetical protein
MKYKYFFGFNNIYTYFLNGKHPGTMKIIVATGVLMSSASVATVIFLVLIWHKKDCQHNLLHWILLPPIVERQWAHVCTHIPTDILCERKNDRLE